MPRQLSVFLPSLLIIGMNQIIEVDQIFAKALIKCFANIWSTSII